MRESLSEGFKAEKSWRVTDGMSPPHLPAKVLSTPSMVQLIEQTCLEAIVPHLDETETSVGTHINVSHAGSASSGEEVLVKARLVKIERRRLTFEVQVHSPRGLISEGTHQRAVVDRARFG
jgi:fluoroacetyl-CoA thioesterase